MPRLPVELWHEICGQYLGLADIKTLRHMSKELATVGAYYVFEILDVALDAAGASRLCNLAANPHLLVHVRELRLWTDVLRPVANGKELLITLTPDEAHFYLMDRDAAIDFLISKGSVKKSGSYKAARREMERISKIIRRREMEWTSIREEQLRNATSESFSTKLKALLGNCLGLTNLSIRTTNQSSPFDHFNTRLTESTCGRESFEQAGATMIQTALSSVSQSACLKQFTVDPPSWNSWLIRSRNKENLGIPHSLRQVTNFSLANDDTNFGHLSQWKAQIIPWSIPTLTPRVVHLRLGGSNRATAITFSDVFGDLKLADLKSIYLDAVILSPDHMLSFFRNHNKVLEDVTIRDARIGKDDTWLSFLSQIPSAISLKRIHFVDGPCGPWTALHPVCADIPKITLSRQESRLCCWHWLNVEYYNEGTLVRRKVHIQRALSWLICGQKINTHRLPVNFRWDYDDNADALWEAISWSAITEHQLETLASPRLREDLPGVF